MSIFKRLREGIVCRSAEDTMQLGSALVPELPENRVLALEGNLGAGKTTFVKGVGNALGLDPNAITSPTFNIYTIHQGNRQLIHMDGYRLDAGNTADDLLIEEFLRDPWLIAVEWPDRGLADWMEPYTWRLLFKRNREDNSLVVQLTEWPEE